MPQFRLVHMIYLVALLAASLATFGARGLIPGGILTVFWGVVYTSPTRRKAFQILGPALIAGLVWWLTWKASTHPVDMPRRMACSYNLKQIALALHDYHEVYKCFPPAYIADENGKPMHSWRVLILRFLEQQNLYNAYRFDEPWDSPSNRQLVNAIPSDLRCPSRRDQSPTARAYTDYFAVVGPSAAWPGTVGRRLSEFNDDKTMTILVVEVAGQNVLWSEPRDLTIDEAMKLVESGDPSREAEHRDEGMFREDIHTLRNIAMVDGGTRLVSTRLSRDVWSHLLTIDDGVRVSEDDLYPDVPTPQRLKVSRCIRLGAWIILALLPIPWALRERNDKGSRMSAAPEKETG